MSLTVRPRGCRSAARSLYSAVLLAVVMLHLSAPAAFAQAPEQAPATSITDAAAEADASQSAVVNGSNATPEVSASHDIAVPGAAAQTSLSQATLPHDLSPWGMFLAADMVVKSIMVGLVAASFLVWTLWLGKLVQLFVARRRLSGELSQISGQTTLEGAVRGLTSKHSLARGMLDAAQRELQTAVSFTGVEASQRVASRLGEIEIETNRSIRGGMSFLATVGATAPFIGLFGTVWGIMNSFIGISKTQTTNLAVVAPGIAEALLATAIGLVAAIPAVIIYNNLAQAITAFKRLTRETKGEVGRIVSRQIETRTVDRPAARLHVAAE